MRTTLETRQAQLFMQVYAQLQERELHYLMGELIMRWEWRDLDDFLSKYGPETNMEAFNKFSLVVTYFDGLGILVRENLVDIRLVTRVGLEGITVFWEKFAPIIDDLRDHYRMPRMMQDTQYLYHAMQRFVASQPEGPSQSRIPSLT